MKPGKQPIQIGIRWWENLRRYSRKKKKKKQGIAA